MGACDSTPVKNDDAAAEKKPKLIKVGRRNSRYVEEGSAAHTAALEEIAKIAAEDEEKAGKSAAENQKEEMKQRRESMAANNTES
jgi:hypothetical protein